MNANTDNQTDNVLNIDNFVPRDDHERKVARIDRMMLNYWTLRTMIERNRESGRTVSKLMTDKAKAVRVQAFREEMDALDHGLRLADNQPLFDDERLKQTGTRIAYLLLSSASNFEVGEYDHATALINDALRAEEQIVTIEVYRALYDVDLLDQRIAA